MCIKLKNLWYDKHSNTHVTNIKYFIPHCASYFVGDNNDNNALNEMINKMSQYCKATDEQLNSCNLLPFF